MAGFTSTQPEINCYDSATSFLSCLNITCLLARLLPFQLGISHCFKEKELCGWNEILAGYSALPFRFFFPNKERVQKGAGIQSTNPSVQLHLWASFLIILANQIKKDWNFQINYKKSIILSNILMITKINGKVKFLYKDCGNSCSLQWYKEDETLTLYEHIINQWATLWTKSHFLVLDTWRDYEKMICFV